MVKPHRHRVLLVDDDDPHRQALRYYFEGIDGFECEEASDGPAALQRFVATPRTCAIVADLAMPGMDGWTLVEQLRAIPGGRAVVVIVVSGHPIDPARAQRGRIQECFVKPADPRAIVAALVRHCPFSGGVAS